MICDIIIYHGNTLKIPTVYVCMSLIGGPSHPLQHSNNRNNNSYTQVTHRITNGSNFGAYNFISYRSIHYKLNINVILALLLAS